MIRRLLFLAIAAVGALWLLRRLSRPASAASAGARGVPRFEGAMVRDRICSTFLPRSRALLVQDGGEEHFFCSEACRTAFLARHRAAR